MPRLSHHSVALFIFLAICFVALGTYVMFINGTQVESNGAAFAAQLISLFTSTIGGWIYPVIALAAITVMYSTLLTLVDLLPRSSAAAMVEIFPVPEDQVAGKFSRMLSLPGHIDTQKVEASCTDGILTVVLPKAEAAKPKQITVRAG